VDQGKMRQAVGVLREELAGWSVDEWMEELRGPAELPDPS